MRTEADAGDAGNKIAMMLVELGTDVDDGAGSPRRGAALDVGSRRSRARPSEARVMADGAELLPGALLGLGVRANAINTARGTDAPRSATCA